MAHKAIGQDAPDFYVYEITVDGICRYIGKGCGDRRKEHLRTAKRISIIRVSGKTFKTSKFYNRLVRAYESGSLIRERVIAYFLHEEEALALERKEIARIPKAQRWNTLDGGEGFTSKDVTERWRNPDYKLRMSNQSKQNWLDQDFRENQIKVRSEADYRDRASESLKVALSRPEVRQKMSDRKKTALADPAKRKAFFDRMDAAKRTPEARRNIGDSKKSQWSDPEWRAKVIAAQNIGKAKARARKPKK